MAGWLEEGCKGIRMARSELESGQTVSLHRSTSSNLYPLEFIKRWRSRRSELVLADRFRSAVFPEKIVNLLPRQVHVLGGIFWPPERPTFRDAQVPEHLAVVHDVKLRRGSYGGHVHADR